jgi:fatty-acyl-CoA synthase
VLEATMMNVPLTVELLAERAARHFAHVEIVSRQPDRSLARTTYGAVVRHARQLARALVQAGLGRGERVATLMWNHAEHLEAYLGIPLAGGVVHTLNLRLHPSEIAFIATDARDRFVIVDEVLLPLLDKVCLEARFEKIIVVGKPQEGRLTYAEFLATAQDSTRLPRLEENDALGCCYTSGTTGAPKGVVYSHRSTILHSMVTSMPDALGLSRSDSLLAVVPMFHVNAWGLPYTGLMIGTRQIFPGPHLDPNSLLDLMEQERVTVAAGVPTIWIGIRDALDAKPRQLQPGLRMAVGGAAAPEKLIRDFDRQGLTIIHGWGMTEMSPLGSLSVLPPECQKLDADTRYRLRAKQGIPLPLVDLRVKNDAGDVPHDGVTTGEVLVRGPWIASRYATLSMPERWTDDGYFRTGDVGTIDEYGFIQLTDRMADLIKSGGEWIASQVLEGVLMSHPAVREAAVIGVPHPRWSERPLAVVVLKPGAAATAEELRAFLEPKVAKYWVPDAIVFAASIPLTSTGKFKKTELRAQYRDWQW